MTDINRALERQAVEMVERHGCRCGFRPSPGEIYLVRLTCPTGCGWSRAAESSRLRAKGEKTWGTTPTTKR